MGQLVFDVLCREMLCGPFDADCQFDWISSEFMTVHLPSFRKLHLENCTLVLLTLVQEEIKH